MSLPPHAALRQVVRGLCAHLDTQLEGLLQDPYYAEDAQCLVALSNSQALEATLAHMPESEAAWLAERLHDRWSHIASPELPPELAILAPEELWLGQGQVEVVMRCVASGVQEEPCWEDGSTGWQRALFVGQVGTLKLSATAGPCSAHAQVRIRSPRVLVRDDGACLVVEDQDGLPGAGLPVRIGLRPMAHTDAQGRLLLDTPISVEESVDVAGLPISPRWT